MPLQNKTKTTLQVQPETFLFIPTKLIRNVCNFGSDQSNN